MKNFFRKAVKKILRTMHPDLELMMVSQFRFNRLKRRFPELMWKILPPLDVPRHDAGRAQIGSELYIIGGFMMGGQVMRDVVVFDMELNCWIKKFSFPKEMSESHFGIASDGRRYIYIISGQLGNHCSPPTRNCFVLDIITQKWDFFSALPKARYAPTVQIWNGRLHVIGGSDEDRNTPAQEHWSIGFKNGQPVDNWREEVPIPRGGPHRASAVVENQLYVFGGQEGDYVAIPQDPAFLCTRDLTQDIVYPDVYMLEQGTPKWKRMADMPVGSSHTENATLVVKRQVVILGGDTYSADKYDPKFTDVIQVYDPSKNIWKVIGHLPYHAKSIAAAYYNGWIYFTTGQRDREDGTPRPGKYDQRAWRAKLIIE